MHTKKQLLPVGIRLPERVLLENGTLFVTLRTLDELEQFWVEHKGRFQFACEGNCSGADYLREFEWVFGNSKATVVQTVMRWGKSEIDCQFSDWAVIDPLEHQVFFGTVKSVVIKPKESIDGQIRMKLIIRPTASAALQRVIAAVGSLLTFLAGISIMG